MRRRPHIGLAGIAILGLVALSILGSRLAGAVSPGSAQLARAPAPVPSDSQRIATFAGGGFWSMQKAFDGIPRVVSTTADRKSTRLNSSHQIISYAVFFLKKKKKRKIDVV